ncbi:hypothetical protein J4471_05800 [Candidatus Woesearchaeota archaeon]|nr:hypothetical protein [Candidatus Woesearchaeota archaeon]
MVKVLRKRTMLLISLFLSIIVFSAGFLLGYGLDRGRINDVMNELDNLEFERESYLTEQQFAELFDGDECHVIYIRLNQLSGDLAEAGKILTDYESRGIFSGDDYKNLKLKYFLSEIKFYILLKQLNDECNLDRSVILFFYDQDQRASKQQGYALDAVVRRVQNITVLSIDRGLSKGSFIDIIKNYYNITSSPTIIINFDKKIIGYTSVDGILELIDRE